MNCLHLRNLGKNHIILQIRCRNGSGNAAKLKTIKNRSSIHSKETMFQFLAKSGNIYLTHGKVRWNGNLRRFSGSQCVSNSFLIVFRVYYDYSRASTYFNCLHLRNLLKKAPAKFLNPIILNILTVLFVKSFSFNWQH